MAKSEKKPPRLGDVKRCVMPSCKALMVLKRIG